MTREEKAKDVALTILGDRHGAVFYEDVTLLSKYLEEALGITKEKADQTAKAIQDDRRGANYYENAEILTKFLRT
jgi:Mn-dependent DtxR family transcriptional regulator